MNNHEASVKDFSGQHTALSYTVSNERPIANVFFVCDQRDTAPVWGYILRQRGLIVILEKAIDRWSAEMPDLVVIDLNVDHEERMALGGKKKTQQNQFIYQPG